MPVAYSYSRFSDPIQEQGDSLRRQIERYRTYCTRHTLQRDESLVDRGLSGFHGKHLAKGAALRRFFDMIQTPENPTGKVKPGDYLIVENLDRFSRQKPLTAIARFSDIINAGVKLVTLTPEIVFDDETIEENPLLIQIAVMEMVRAHGESKRKADLVSRAFDNLRKEARTTGKPITKRCPNWLFWDGKGFAFRPGAKQLMTRICNLAIKGTGPVSIAQILNREGVPSLSIRKKSRKSGLPLGPKCWEFSTVQFWLRSRLLLGEHQPKKRVNGKLVPDGEPIKGYYPAVLTEKKFYAVQAALDTRKKNVRGRAGKNVANLFGRILKDGFDGGTLTLSQKHKENLNLISLNAVRGFSKLNSFPYKPFEDAFLTFIRELDLSSLNGEPKASRLDELNGRLSEVRAKMEKLDALLDNANADETFDRLIVRMKNYGDEEVELKQQIETERANQERPRIDTTDIKAFIEKMREATDDSRLVREQLRAAIQSLCTEITLYVYSHTVTRVAIAYVRFQSGADRVFSVRVERNKPTISTTDGIFYGGYSSPPAVQRAVADAVAPFLLEASDKKFVPPPAIMKKLEKLDEKAAMAFNCHACLLVGRFQARRSA